jgi:hypothetical protein
LRGIDLHQERVLRAREQRPRLLKRIGSGRKSAVRVAGDEDLAEFVDCHCHCGVAESERGTRRADIDDVDGVAGRIHFQDSALELGVALNELLVEQVDVAALVSLDVSDGEGTARNAAERSAVQVRNAQGIGVARTIVAGQRPQLREAVEAVGRAHREVDGTGRCDRERLAFPESLKVHLERHLCCVG